MFAKVSLSTMRPLLGGEGEGAVDFSGMLPHLRSEEGGQQAGARRQAAPKASVTHSMHSHRLPQAV